MIWIRERDGISGRSWNRHRSDVNPNEKIKDFIERVEESFTMFIDLNRAMIVSVRIRAMLKIFYYFDQNKTTTKWICECNLITHRIGIQFHYYIYTLWTRFQYIISNVHFVVVNWNCLYMLLFFLCVIVLLFYRRLNLKH